MSPWGCPSRSRREDLPALTEYVIDFLRKNTYSDETTLAIFQGLRIPEEVQDYGLRAKREILQIEDAREVAERNEVRYRRDHRGTGHHRGGRRDRMLRPGTEGGGTARGLAEIFRKWICRDDHGHREGKAIKNEISRVIANTAYQTYEKRLMKEVLDGDVPQHVAIIMDGNRRFAQEFGLTTAEGHVKGKDKLEELLDWCLELGIKVLTVYAFCTENLNRDQDEIEMPHEALRGELLSSWGTTSGSTSNRIKVTVIGQTGPAAGVASRRPSSTPRTGPRTMTTTTTTSPLPTAPGRRSSRPSSRSPRR